MIAMLLALLIGVVAGLRTTMAPAAVSWAAHLGWLHLDGGWLAVLGYAWTPWIYWRSSNWSRTSCRRRPAAPYRSSSALGS